ncbi:hypothetical protein DW352_02795 [Pseudolabrys taiwanensis]|uniref:Aspartate ammonia-lyase n=1 Tax=Pseudolabrys taiwanensis TaxID=331696 RepID=A0A345ZRJ3_9HYPH|nr:hypothetical protein [Pseudolabrys taiwanensis]AXK79540.1 hypothetical protein DW352_02795 [Pseudolabrys taiwanensis]
MANTSTTGAAGEHYVMCQLLRRGLIAALAPTGVPNADIIVTDEIGDKLCAVQVKTRLKPGSDKGWHMSVKHERIISPNIYYCFVGFETQPPGCWIMPSDVVADVLKRSHAHWLAQPGKNGQAHKENDMRRLCESYDHENFLPEFSLGWLDPYKDRWDLLEAATKE